MAMLQWDGKERRGEEKQSNFGEKILRKETTTPLFFS